MSATMSPSALKPFGIKHAANGAAVIAHIEPVADLLAIAINRKRLARERVVNDKRNKFFGKVVGAVIVGAVGGEHGQVVGVVIGAHQMIRRGLACGVRTVGFVAIGFAEGGVSWRK